MSTQPNTSTRRRPGRRRLRGLGLVLTAVMVAGAALGTVKLASASTDGVHDDGIMELDGSIDTTGNVCDYKNAPVFPTVPSSTTCTPAADTTAPATAPWDWSSIFNSTSPGTKDPTTGFYPGASAPYSGSPVSSDPGFVNATFQPYNGDLFTKGSKDVGDVSSWSCTQQANPPKDQLANTYGAAFRATSPVAGVVQANDTVLNLAIERPSTSGNANAGFWFFQQPVLCDPSTGTFSNGHSNGDLFMVGSFLGGGSNSVLSVFEWQCPHTGPTTACTSAGSLTSIGTDNAPCPQASGDAFCEVVNQNSTVVNGKQQFETWNVNTPWNDGQSGSIPGPGFLELGIDLSSIFRGLSQSTPCFSSFLADTRSSGSSAQAETKDFINHSFPTCFPMTVHKYIDQNLNGAFDSGTDLNGSGWPITVKDSASKVICSGTTGSDGNLSCATGSLTNLPPGTYTVTETQRPGFYNTDPGTGSTCNDTASTSTTPPDASDVNEAASVSCTVSVGSRASAVQLGNQCLVSLTLTVTGIPAGTTGVHAQWSVASGFDAGKSSSPTGAGNLADVALTPTTSGGTTYQGTSTFPFIQNDKVSWSFYVNGNSANTEPGKTGVDLSGGIFSATTGTAGCAITSTGIFTPSRIQGIKYKDVTGTGLGTGGSVPSGDPGIGGFAFDLVALANSTPLTSSALTTAVNTACSGTVTTNCLYGTATSASAPTPPATAPPAGQFTFAGVNPGYYQVHEVGATGWNQTAPVTNSSPTDYVVQVKLGDGTDTSDVNNVPIVFLDTPTYDFSMTFHSDADLPGTSTPETNGKITCSPNPSTSTGSGSGSYTSGIQQGASATYQCTLTVTDP